MAVKRQVNTDKPKRLRKRKARTEVSSSSESSDTESEAEEEPVKQVKKTKDDITSAKKSKKVTGQKAAKANDKPSPPSSASSSSASSSSEEEEDEEEEALQPNTLIPTNRIKASDAEAAFESFYLRQLTSEIAEDLDKIRSAGDFSDASLGLLISALKQGGTCFSMEERLGVGRSLVSAANAAATEGGA